MTITTTDIMDENRGWSSVDSSLAVSEWVDKAGEIAAKVNPNTAIPKALAIAQAIWNDFHRTAVNIAIIGSANAGKSSLINLLIGQSLLPVGVTSHRALVCLQRSEGMGKEGFFTSDDPDTMYPLSVFRRDRIPGTGEGAAVTFELNHSWLSQTNFRLMEMPPLSMGDEDVEGALAAVTQLTDALVLVVDGLSPMRRDEARLLSHCVKQSIPTVVVVTKVDKLSAEDYVTTMDYVNSFTSACSDVVRVIPLSDRTAETQSAIAQLKTTIEGIVTTADISTVRTRRLGYALQIALKALTMNTQAIQENQRRDNQEKATELRKRQHEIDLQNLEWQKIRQRLTTRRHKVDGLLRTKLQSNHSVILDELLYDLDAAEDFKAWWRRDFTAQLAQEIQKTATQITETINQQAIADIEWLQQEAQRQFEFPITDIDEPNAEANQVPIPAKSVIASDENVSNVITRIGTAATAILVRVLTVRYGSVMAELVTDVAAGLVTEQLIYRNQDQEKKKIRDELSTIVKKVERAYLQEAAQQLEESYGQIIADLQHQQRYWHQTQTEALKNMEKAGDSQATLEQLSQAIKQLEAEIASKV